MKTKKVFDIFSRKKTREKTHKVEKVIVDYREKNSLVYSELINLGLELHPRELKVADYIVKDVAIERKTVSDFVTSMKNRRLIRQLEDLQQYKKRLLIIEGMDEQELYSDSEDWIGMHPNAIRGFLLSILLKYNVPIIYTKDYKDTAKFINILAKKQSGEIPLNVKKKSFNKKEQLQFIVEGFPGIGPKTARKLLEKFKTIKNLANASEEELKKTIGKKAEKLKELIESDYK